jgi:hypothetical protein
MAFRANPDVNCLAAHSTLHQLAYSVSGIFWSVCLLRIGMSAPEILLASAGILSFRLVFRPLVLVVVSAIGPRRTLALGTLLTALQYPVLALVRGPGLGLLLYCSVTAVGGVFYWTCYHAFFAALGDVDQRGRQLGMRQALSAGAGVLGPAAGGIVLAMFGPWSAFGASAMIEVAAAFPLLFVAEPQFTRSTPKGAYRAAQTGIRLFLTDGWIVCCSAIAWDIFAFRALSARCDTLGGVLSGAALAGALGGWVLGRFIDAGHARRAIWVTAIALCTIIILKSVSGADLVSIASTAGVSAILGGLYIPTLMTAVYNAAKDSPCPLRFQFAAEAGWDVGGMFASLTAALACALGVSLQVVILLALPAVALQTHLLIARYRVRTSVSIVAV